MSTANYKRLIHLFFENSIDLLSWEEFEKFMEKRSIVGEENIASKLDGFPLLDILNCTPDGRSLVKIEESPRIWASDKEYIIAVKKSVEKLVKKYSPYVYGNAAGIFPKDNKMFFVMSFAGCDIEGHINIKPGNSREIIFYCEKVGWNIALKTNDGILFQRTPVGVILYDRRKRRSYTESLDNIYEFYS